MMLNKLTNMNNNFFIGILLVLFGLWNFTKEDEKYPNIFTKVNLVDDWGIVILFIVSGIIMIIKYV